MFLRSWHDVVPFSHCQVTFSLRLCGRNISTNKQLDLTDYLPKEQLSQTKFKLVDWTDWSSVSSEGGASQLEPSSNIDKLPGSHISGVIEGSHEKPHNPDMSVFAKLSEHLDVTDCGQSISYQTDILEKP